jgi:signal transduction histidine kinase/ActR/RegA family two-component response regulator
MENGWSSLLSTAASLFLFALATQGVLAWIFSLLFLAFLRASGEAYFRCWTWAWLARAVGLTMLLVRFTVPLAQGDRSSALDGTLFSDASYFLYQSAKLLANWWLLEGVLSFGGFPLARARTGWIAALLVLVALGSVLLMGQVGHLLLAQSPLVIVAGSIGAWVLLRLPAPRRSAGTRITAVALLTQSALWSVYFLVYLDTDRGPWPVVQTPASLLAAHNSYFDLAVDVLIASGLMVMLLQDVHRRHMEAEEERARLRTELERSDRLHSLGTLVSGVAHELNNPLTAILGFAEALGSPDGPGERQRYANVIREQALRCRRIVRGLATFTGGESDVYEKIDVRALLERVTSGFEFELAHRRVHVAIQAPASLPPLLGDRFALEQLLANLLANAVKASPPGGRVTLSESGNGHEIELVVEDEGPGIPSSILARIFDPFFTTRAPGEGMGLGLAVAHGIVQAHGGTIRAENRRPHGARLTVVLPLRCRSEPLGREALVERDVPRPLRSSAPLELLVIEDEPPLRELLASLGARRGWHVTLEGTGRAGLARLRSEGERFDAILCDLRMHTLSGFEIHDCLAAEAPRLLERCLFVTGDLGSEEAAAFALRCARPILLKPFEIADLAARIEGLASARRSTEAAPRPAARISPGISPGAVRPGAGASAAGMPN